jgi:hypothetical protein
MAVTPKAPAAKPAPVEVTDKEIIEAEQEVEDMQKHIDTVMVQNVHNDSIDMKHQLLVPKGIGLATVAEQEALHMYLKVVK